MSLRRPVSYLKWQWCDIATREHFFEIELFFYCVWKYTLEKKSYFAVLFFYEWTWVILQLFFFFSTHNFLSYPDPEAQLSFSCSYWHTIMQQKHCAPLLIKLHYLCSCITYSLLWVCMGRRNACANTLLWEKIHINHTMQMRNCISIRVNSFASFLALTTGCSSFLTWIWSVTSTISML